MKPVSIELSDIRTDGGTQPRTSISDEVVSDYRERMENGDAFPPADVFYDGKDYWLADGFHRFHACEAAGFKTIECRVHQGALADAQWFSYGANQAHDKSGLRRGNEDKQRAVQAALRHPMASKFSDRQIAEHVGVSNAMVSKHRQVLTVNTSPDNQPQRRTGKDGKSYPATQPVRKPAPTRESEKTIINSDTGEVIDNADVVTTTTKRDRFADAKEEERERAREARELIKKEKHIGLEFHKTYQAFFDQVAAARRAKFAGDTSIEAARECVRTLVGLVELDA